MIITKDILDVRLARVVAVKALSSSRDTHLGRSHNFYIEGDRQGSENNCGEGPPFGQWIQKAFQPELRRLSEYIAEGCNSFMKNEYIYIPFNIQLAIYPCDNRVKVRTGIGWNQMEFLLNVLGYKIRNTRGTSCRTWHLISRLQPEDYESEKLDYPAMLKIKKGVAITLVKETRELLPESRNFGPVLINWKIPPVKETLELLAENVFFTKALDVTEELAWFISGSGHSMASWVNGGRSFWPRPDEEKWHRYRFGWGSESRVEINAVIERSTPDVKALSWRDVLNEIEEKKG